jgi:adenylate kinase family enzyme
MFLSTFGDPVNQNSPHFIMKPKLINQHTCIDLFKFWKPKEQDPKTQNFIFLHFPTNQKQHKGSISQANPQNFQKQKEENFARLRRLM